MSFETKQVARFTAVLDVCWPQTSHVCLPKNTAQEKASNLGGCSMTFGTPRFVVKDVMIVSISCSQ